ncbi:NAD(P)-dependent alcohol dehydrogenase [Phytohabitans rumicis]|uniref:NADPH:quinone reductase n=1 Tax=Phytohabitans rumicis TaxID=1076125 RepID=A0A6V8KTH4_9ACTN|nr:NAD(P)-dependent alcohol dehydrogenase [Phytohabitans rumicis]GFJ88422.1 NADPH:quinone reductase [Phytohabitans rumicis]
MKAITQDRYGEPGEVLKLRDIDRPTVGDDGVLVKVRAAGVDHGVWHMTTGQPYLMRIMGFGFRGPKAPAAGRDLAGVVESVGRDVTRVKPGDEVYGVSANGSFAEYTCTTVDRLAAKPANLTFEQAAAVPVSGATALHAVRDAAAVKAGQRVLVIGAGGGVGTYAVQLAKAYGGEVTGLCGPTKVDLVRSIGASEVIDYTRAEVKGQYDVILDIAGNRPLSQLRKALTPRGTLVIVGGEAGGNVFGGMGRNLGGPLLSPFVGQRLRNVISTERAIDLDDLRALIEAGKVTPAVDRTYPLADVPEAVRALRAGQARGKFVVII